jgi:hypothetical protein
MLALIVAGYFLWTWHARAWDLGGRSPVLSFDAAQYTVAARELAVHGRFATTFVLPVELAKHPAPPWPLAVVQPGLVLAEAAFEKLLPRTIGSLDLSTPARREWLALLLPFACFLATGVVLAWSAARMLARAMPRLGQSERALAGFVVGAAFLLDPEAQHFAVGGFTELPFTLGIVCALAWLASESAGRAPLRFGLLLGVTGLFRGTMLWVAPLFCGAAALIATPPSSARRGRVFALALLGYALVLAPWWFYKWRVFGTPAWDLSGLALWDGVAGWTWLSLTHLPQMPQVPHGGEAVSLIAAKLARNLRTLSLQMTLGPRALWFGALAAWLLVAREQTTLRVTGFAVLGHVLLAMVAAALGSAWLRYLFPARIAFEAAGVLAMWALIGRAPATILGAGGQRVVRIAVAVLVLGWGTLQTIRGGREAREASAQRGLPSVATLEDLAGRIARDTPPGTAVMSNLGPTLAWYAGRPVVHLALTPADVDACRRRFDVRHVVLAFQSAERAWPGWSELVERPDEARLHPEWNVEKVRAWRSRDGYEVVWLELGALTPQLAGRH